MCHIFINRKTLQAFKYLNNWFEIKNVSVPFNSLLTPFFFKRSFSSEPNWKWWKLILYTLCTHIAKPVPCWSTETPLIYPFDPFYWINRWVSSKHSTPKEGQNLSNRERCVVPSQSYSPFFYSYKHSSVYYRPPTSLRFLSFLFVPL